MKGFFAEGKLVSVMVYGNGQSLYYTEDKNGSISGVNVAECSDMRISLVEQRVSEITLVNEPDATLYPMKEVPREMLELKGFRWLENIRPSDRFDIFRKPSDLRL